MLTVAFCFAVWTPFFHKYFGKGLGLDISVALKQIFILLGFFPIHCFKIYIFNMPKKIWTRYELAGLNNVKYLKMTCYEAKSFRVCFTLLK